MIHQTPEYFQNPLHRITIDLVGMGGTGSQVLTGLGRMNEALQGLGHPGIFVRAWDPDNVEQSNVGRQLFSTSDIGQNKANVLLTRANRYFGLEWESVPEHYTGVQKSNILITCVDSAAARIAIGAEITKSRRANEHTDKCYYWLDIGNLQTTGQVIIGSMFTTSQKGMKENPKLKTVVEFFPQLKKIKEEKQGPSCSLAEALEKQDLFINSTLAQFGCNLLWKLLREGMIKHQGCYVNLETLTVNPIRIK